MSTDSPTTRRVDDFLTDLDDVLATSVVPDSTPDRTDTETRHDTPTPDTTGHDTGHGKDKTRHAGRVLTLHRPPEGPRPIHELLPPTEQEDTTPDTGHDTTDKEDTKDKDTPPSPPKPSPTAGKTRSARRALRKDTAAHAKREDATEGSDSKGSDSTEDAEAEAPRTLGQRITQGLGKLQQGAVGAADQIAASIKTESPEAAAEQERIARALDNLTSALQPVEPDRSWLPRWAGTVGTFLLFNLSAAAAGHYPLVLWGHKNWSPAQLVYDLLAPFASPDYHWSNALIFGAIPALACWFFIERRTRRLNSVILRWLARIPLASVTAGALTATWTVLIHLATGATS